MGSSYGINTPPIPNPSFPYEYAQDYSYNKSTVPEICIEFEEKEEREQKRKRRENGGNVIQFRSIDSGVRDMG